MKMKVALRFCTQCGVFLGFDQWVNYYTTGKCEECERKLRKAKVKK